MARPCVPVLTTGRHAVVPTCPPAAGVPACSTPVLKSLAGKAGKARKRLAELGIIKPAEGERAPGAVRVKPS